MPPEENLIVQAAPADRVASTAPTAEGRSPGAAPEAKLRLVGIDTLRALSIILVIYNHAYYDKFLRELYKGSPLYYGQFVLGHFSQVAVPLFLIAAGYFLGKSMQKGRDPAALAWRKSITLVRVFLFWSVVYWLLAGLPAIREQGWMQGTLNRLAEFAPWIAANPVEFLVRGTKSHLWFVPALCTSFAVLAVLMRLKLTRYLLPAAMIIYVMSVWIRSYKTAPFALPFYFDARESALFALAFNVVGWRLAYRERLISKRWALAMIASGSFLAGIEIWALWQWGMPERLSCYLGTLPLSVGLFALVLHYPDFGRGTPLAWLGRLTLGIYVMHYVPYAAMLHFRRDVPPLIWDMLSDPLLILFCAAVTWLLQRSRATSWIVS